MRSFIKFVALAVVLTLALFIAVIAGDDGPWYFAWLVGTTMIILIAAAGAVLMETQTASGKAGSEF